ncbi:MAG: hypothetical protein ACRBBN_14620 [Methyloligellaceae bacterium]
MTRITDTSEQLDADLSIQLIQKRSTPNFRVSSKVINDISGYYLLYRVSSIFNDSEYQQCDIDSGWLEKQKIEVVPVRIEENNGNLVYSDFYPDASINKLESVALITETENGTYKLYGLDKDNDSYPEFNGDFTLPDSEEMGNNIFAKGVISGNHRPSITYSKETYNFCIEKVEKKIFYSYLDQGYNIIKDNQDNLRTIEEKREMIINRSSFVITASTLLNEEKFDLLHFIFNMKNITTKELADIEIVRNMSPSTLQFCLITMLKNTKCY